MPVNYGHHRSDRIHDVMHPAYGIRDQQIRQGKKPHDHTRDNKLHIKALMQIQTERRAARAAAAEAAAVKPSPRFASVESRVAAQLARPASAPSRPKPAAPGPKNFACPKPSGPPGRIFTAWAPPPLLGAAGTPGASAALLPRAKVKPAVPSRQPAPPKAPAVDFVKRNADLAALSPRKAAASPPSPPGTGEKSRHHGRIPPYLLDRKMEMASAAAAREAALLPRECPVGTHLLPEEERVQVLAMVEQGRETLHKELDAMPFVIDTYGLKSKNRALHKQLEELEAAERAFSRKKVIVADEPPTVDAD